MPHQCLKCGNLFPDGSSQILRGCPDCRGTRFFFTEEAIPEADRAKLLKEGEADIKAILEDLSDRSGVKEPPAAPAEVRNEEPREAPVPQEPAASEPPPMPERTTAKMLPGNRLLIKMKHRRLAKRVQQARRSPGWDYEAPPEPRAPVADPEPEPTPEPRSEPRAKKAPRPAAVRDPKPSPVVDRVDADAPWPAPSEQEGAAKQSAPVERVSYEGEESPATGDDEAQADEEQTVRFELLRTPAEPAGDSDSVPETVRIDAPGEYNIDVKRLLEEAPIVVQKDGSYLIHLPSLFDGDEARKKGR